MASDSNTDSEVRSTSSEEDFGELLSDFNEFGIRPYQFEPQKRSNKDSNQDSEEEDSEESEGEPEDSRLTNSEWCQCENCQIMDREHVCINKWVLKTACFQYKEKYTDSYEGPEHKQFRHVAYHQLARWCWGFLGKDVRVVLPSCAVMCIRAHFPPPGLEEDFVFEGFHFANE